MQRVTTARNTPDAALASTLLRAFDLLFQLLVAVTIFLPSGTLYGVNFKSPLYVFLLPVAVYRFFKKQATPAGLVMFFVVAAVPAVWLLIGVYQNVELAGVYRQYLDVIVTLLLCWLTTLYCDNSQARRLSFLRLVLYSEVATCFMKIGLIGYAVARGIPVPQMVQSMSDAFNFQLMTMDLGGMLGRVQFVSDALIPLCLFLLLRHRDRLGIGPASAAVQILLLCTSVVFSFSRYFWLFSVIALLLGLALGKRDRFQMAVIGILAVAVLVSLPALSAMYELRLSDAIAGGSDADRVAQRPVLQSFFLRAPIMGNGLGSFPTEMLRADVSLSTRYSYEMQLLALTGQVGIVGITCFVALLAWYYRALWWSGRLATSDRFAIASMLLLWLSVGWYNPILINPVASLCYATLAVLTQLTTGSQQAPAGM